MAILYNENYKGTTPFSDVSPSFNLVAATAQSYTVPGDSTTNYQAVFEYTENSNIYISKNVMPVIPTSGSTVSVQYQAFRPDKRYVRGGDVLYLITPDTSAYMGFSLMQI